MSNALVPAADVANPPPSSSAPSQGQYLPSVALFGATGGCLLATLTRLLTSPTTSTQLPQHISVLVRSASKLRGQLDSRGVAAEVLSDPARLRIVEGDALTDREKVVETITLPKGGGSGRFVDVILSGIGAYPHAKLLPPFLALDNPTLCHDAMAMVLSILQASTDSNTTGPTTTKKPLIIAISSTGLYRGGNDDPRDLHLPMLALYKCLLSGIHKDKIAMEDVLTSAAAKPGVCDFIIARAAMFTNSAAESKPLRAGYAQRVTGSGEGVRWGDLSGPAFGYTVSREDVGRWIWEEVASGRNGWSNDGVFIAEWKGKKVSLANS